MSALDEHTLTAAGTTARNARDTSWTALVSIASTDQQTAGEQGARGRARSAPARESVEDGQRAGEYEQVLRVEVGALHQERDAVVDRTRRPTAIERSGAADPMERGVRIGGRGCEGPMTGRRPAGSPPSLRGLSEPRLGANRRNRSAAACGRRCHAYGKDVEEGHRNEPTVAYSDSSRLSGISNAGSRNAMAIHSDDAITTAGHASCRRETLSELAMVAVTVGEWEEWRRFRRPPMRVLLLLRGLLFGFGLVGDVRL